MTIHKCLTCGAHCTYGEAIERTVWIADLGENIRAFICHECWTAWGHKLRARNLEDVVVEISWRVASGGDDDGP